MFWNKFHACHDMSNRIQLAIDVIDDEMRRLQVERLLTPQNEIGMYLALSKLNRYYWELKNPTALEG